MDPNEIKNPKQINRVVLPIKLDAQGHPIKNNKVNTIIASKKKQSSLTTVFVIIFLLLLALISFLLLYIIIPNIQSERKNNYIVERTTTSKKLNSSFSITSGMISESLKINMPGEYYISDLFKINILDNGRGINVLVNNRLVDKGEYLHSKVALVHDLILITITKGVRNTKFYAVTSDGDIVYTLYNLTDDGMIINKDVELQYNSASIIINSTRIDRSNLILDSREGNTQGLNICDYELLGENNIDENFSVISNYSLEYLGNHKFSRPNIINSVSLRDYRTQFNYCNN